ncbi:ATP/GTP-binding protein [Streptomyces sp. A475]|uniref:ATP/GTP-binding protein n=1 Tax=Streptomyces sp. A475 TaxID=3131976 RepID=UPI0030ECCA2E
MKEGKRKGGKGAVYRVMCPATGRVGVVWVPDGAAPGAPVIDPEVVAQQAVDSMKLVGPDIDINPKPGGKGLVGMPVWMAVGQSPTTYGPNSASATAGGVTVTATAKVKSIVWNMGDGTSVTCSGPGTVYRKSFGMKQSPDCGHVYKQTSDSAGGKFKVSATATWAVDWQVAGGGGESGQLTEVRNSQAALTIIESQAVN